MQSPSSYTRLQVALHWAVAAGIAVAWFTGDGMGRYLRDRFEQDLTGLDGATTHTIAGSIVLALVVWRLALRFWHGAPAPVGAPLIARAATVGHWLLYALMVAVPASGALLWYGGVRSLGDVHETLAPLFVIVILGHAAMALWHGLVKRDGTLRHMSPGT